MRFSVPLAVLLIAYVAPLILRAGTPSYRTFNTKSLSFYWS